MSRRTIFLSSGLSLFIIAFGLTSLWSPINDQPIPFPRPIEGIDSVFLEELTWMEVRDAIASGTDSIIVPTGGVEQNGPYLALGKHNYILELTTESIARALGRTLVAPIVKFVPEGNINPPDGHMQFPGTISVRDSTFESLLTDICESLHTHGFKRIYLIGDSGGNQQGMKQVAGSLKHRGVQFVPEYYDYDFITQWLTERGYTQISEGIHDDLAFSAQVITRNPELARAAQRRKVGKFSVNAIPLDPIEKTIELGREIIKVRTDRTVEAIRKLQSTAQEP